MGTQTKHDGHLASTENERPAKREPIGHVTATVTFPLYEGDSFAESEFPWFVYEEPGITSRGELGVCKRECQTLNATVEMLKKEIA